MIDWLLCDILRLCSVGRSSEEDSRGEADESADGGEPDPTLPCTEDVILKTEQVTKNIQELLRAAQEFKHDRWERHTTMACHCYKDTA